ncbi:MAG TPA: alpha/beta fold hydrolase [Anaerolineales bacterium]|nr:alpha/beta fold hydrolase [Anaerolineales bacterium]
MLDARRIMYLHGLDSNSQTYKAAILRGRYPDLITPDFSGSLEERMKQLDPILGNGSNWTLVGSSYGGLMAALFATQHPSQVRKLILLAPALMLPAFAERLPEPIDVPTIIIQGRQDTVVPVNINKPLAVKVFRDLDYRLVDDDHRLHKAAEALDWKSLIE